MEHRAKIAVGEAPLPAENLSAAQIAYYQGLYQDTYRDLVGVHPAERDLLRDQLEIAQQSGLQTLEEIVQEVRTSFTAVGLLEGPSDYSSDSEEPSALIASF